MSLLNYSTTVEASKTVMEIQKILVAHGAKSILTNYDKYGVIESLSFLVNTPQGEAGIKLPVNPQAVLKVMEKYGSKVPYRLQTEAQAVRVAWRIVKDWVEAQMAILETEMVNLDQIFLPYIETQSGQTMYQLFQAKQKLLLSDGNNDHPELLSSSKGEG